MMKGMLRRRYLMAGVALGFGFVVAGGLPHAFAASLYFSPSEKSVAVGQAFVVSVQVSSPDQAMNAASGDISFPSNMLQVLSVSKTNSVMNLWVRDPSFTNSIAGGDVHFEGVVLNPGFTGDAATVIRITFQAVKAGQAPISFSAGAVLANDGNGTNILNSLGTAMFRIVAAPVVTPPSQVGGPAPFVISEVTADPTEPRPIFSWKAHADSGIGKYLVQIGDGDWFDATTIAVSSTADTYRIPPQAPGENIPLTVDAYDTAGSVIEAKTTFSIESLPPPTVTDYAKQISSDQPFIAAGTAVPNATVKIYFENSKNIFSFLVPVDDRGNWSVAQHISLSDGYWRMKAQTIDKRGAMSSFTREFSVTVGGWPWWLILPLLLAALIAIVYYLTRRHHSRGGSGRKVTQVRRELRDDLKRIEKELEADRPRSQVDLSVSGMRKKQERVYKEIEHLEEDLKEDLKDSE